MPETADSSTARAIANLWTKNQPLILERLAQLDAAAAAATSGTLIEPIRAEAESNAHKLSGSLGMFGFHHGTELARELEELLQSASPDPSHLTQLATALRKTLFPTP